MITSNGHVIATSSAEVTLTCEVGGYSSPVTVSWEFNGTLLSNRSSMELTINVSRESEGEYHCIVNESYGLITKVSNGVLVERPSEYYYCGRRKAVKLFSMPIINPNTISVACRQNQLCDPNCES